jgi:peptidoglycan lytic transglycosylase
MQTKLRMIGFVLAFVAGLLFSSNLAAAPTSKAKRPASASKPQYVGIASWYGKQHQGRKMANGQPFDRRKLTAAAWNIPLGTVLHVVNLKNGNSVDVTVTDRGPNHRLRRAIDLSEAAARELDYVGDGLTRVFITPVPEPEFESAEITAQLEEPQFDVPVPITPLERDRRATAVAMAVSLGLVGH